MMSHLLAGAVVALTLAASAALSSQAPAAAADPRVEAQVDKIFARWTAATPGCAVAAAEGDRTVLSKAYGMADLEHEARNTAATIFEAGSVSKQFTAAAVLLLARDGRLSLEDPVRKHIPELPDYGAPLTIRHMLNHTSGLRDWGSVESIAGWPRTTRAYTHAHVLDIVGRQRALNFPSGTRYSYSNTGYNLSAVLVSRVSGMPFADFTAQRIFKPLGMTRTSWRDDYRRIVKDRAMAYADESGSFRTLMPFENVHGNGGLLTTVGDLLIWNRHFGSPSIGDASFVSEQERPGRFNDGRTHQYALGLTVGTRKGLREIAHSGSTAGYRAHLTRFPDQRVSVAVLCNVSTGSATQYAEAVADILLADWQKPDAPPAPKHTLTAAERTAIAGMYRDTVTGESLTVTASDTGVRAGTAPLVAVSPTEFVTVSAQRWIFDPARKTARMTDRYGTVDSFERVAPVTPTAAQLQELAGTYASAEAETTLTAVVESGALVLKRRPDAVMKLAPLYQDAFDAGGLGTVIFRRSGGRVTELTVSQDRVWDLRFQRRADSTRTSSQR